MTKKISLKKTVTLRSDVIQRLDAQAQEENRSFSNMLETAAINYLKVNEHVHM